MRRLAVFTTPLLLLVAIAPTGTAPAVAATLPGGLTQLVIAPEDTAHTYDRARFGSGWIDADKDCQDTRAEVLIQESLAPITFTTTSKCYVSTGKWTSPWSGVTVTSATGVQVDHDVALAEAWRSGAWAWTDAARKSYANDLSFADHLNALPSSENTSKSDRDPANWKPALKSSWCRYARSWDAIKVKYKLTANQAEWDALLTMAATCP